jgi:hypothetical protein
MYGSYDDAGQSSMQCNYEEYFATIKKQPIEITRPEKHRIDDDDDECTESEEEGHSCENFDQCWGSREHVVGVYYWKEGQRQLTENRVDKLLVLRRAVEAA